eukprot:5550-Heterococcus_DN1.PRE.14
MPLKIVQEEYCNLACHGSSAKSKLDTDSTGNRTLVCCMWLQSMCHSSKTADTALSCVASQACIAPSHTVKLALYSSTALRRRTNIEM